MPDGPRVRIVRISNELLADLLLLPPGAKIVGVSDQMFFGTGELVLKIESPEFSPVPPGHAIPYVHPQYNAVSVAKFAGWGG